MPTEKITAVANLHNIKFTGYQIETGYNHFVIHYLLKDGTIYKVRLNG